MSQHESTRTETSTDTDQRAMQQAIKYPIEQTVQFQKGAGQLFLNGLELTNWAQSRGFQMTKQLFDNYISTLEDTARETEALADQGIQTVQEAGERQEQSAQSAMQQSQQPVSGNAPRETAASRRPTQTPPDTGGSRQPQGGGAPLQQAGPSQSASAAQQPPTQSQPPMQGQPPMQSQSPMQGQPPMQSQQPESERPRTGFQATQPTQGVEPSPPSVGTPPTDTGPSPAASQESTERFQESATESGEAQESPEVPQPNP